MLGGAGAQQSLERQVENRKKLGGERVDRMSLLVFIPPGAQSPGGMWHMRLQQCVISIKRPLHLMLQKRCSNASCPPDMQSGSCSYELFSSHTSNHKPKVAQWDFSTLTDTCSHPLLIPLRGKVP